MSQVLHAAFVCVKHPSVTLMDPTRCPGHLLGQSEPNNRVNNVHTEEGGSSRIQPVHDLWSAIGTRDLSKNQISPRARACQSHDHTSPGVNSLRASIVAWRVTNLSKSIHAPSVRNTYILYAARGAPCAP